MNTFKYSIVICTRGLAQGFVRTIESVAGQDFDKSRYEIIVVDNNKTEKVRPEVESAAARHSDCIIRYVLETEAGLHSARHRGAFEARGDIVSYLDDDVTAERSWLRGVAEVFEGMDAVLVGGKILPMYEIEAPTWLSDFVKKVPEGWYLWQLSLVDLGDEVRRIDPRYVFGCNYSIRKDILFECGGFHPDSLPADMLSYRGDGETALSEAINEKGLRAFYSPKVCVYHHIPKERLTVEYFCKRMFNQGVSDSYAKIRKEEGIKGPILMAAEDAYHKGRAFHHEHVLANPSLLDWVLKDDYIKKVKSDLSELSMGTKKEFDAKVNSYFSGVDRRLDWVDDAKLFLGSASIYVTERCNSRCITCNAWKERGGCELDTKQWINILSQVRKMGICHIEFSGGEPLLRKDIDELIRASKKLGFDKIVICTNGLLLTEARLTELVGCGANSFHISLDGMRDTYKFIRGVDGFDKAVNAIRMIGTRGIDLMVLSLLTKQNIDELEMVAMIAQQAEAKWFVNLPENKKFLFDGVEIDSLLITDRLEIDKAVETLRRIRSAFPATCLLGEADITYIEAYLEAPCKEGAVPCTLGFEQLYFDSKGNVYPACMSLGSIGNAAQTYLEELLGSQKMRDSLKAMIARRCKGCTCGYSQRAKLFKTSGAAVQV